MDNLVTYVLMGLFIVLMLSLMRYMQNNTKKNNLEHFLDAFNPDEYLILKSARIGISDKVKFFVDGILISSKGVFIILKSDLRGQIHINDQEEMIDQIIGKRKYKEKNPVFLVMKLVELFHKYMHINRDYIQPIVVFDKQTDLRVDHQCSVPAMKMAALYEFIEKQKDQRIPEEVLVQLKEQFNKIFEK